MSSNPLHVSFFGKRVYIHIIFLFLLVLGDLSACRSVCVGVSSAAFVDNPPQTLRLPGYAVRKEPNLIYRCPLGFVISREARLNGSQKKSSF